MIGNLDGIDNDHIAGWALDQDDPSRRVPVEVFYNGRLLTRTLAAFHRPELVASGVGDGWNGFYVAMPALDRAEEAEVSVVVADTGQPLGASRTIHRRPKCSRSGIVAAEMLRLHTLPVHAMTGVSFDGEHLVVTGYHLPPGGNPSALQVSSTAGTRFTFQYPHHTPIVGDEWYWYWPNGGWSGYRIDIDLPASTDDGPDFTFSFDSEVDDPAGIALGRNQIHVPKNLSTYQRFPQGDQLTRVQRFDSIRDVALRGYTDHCVVTAIAEHYGADLTGANVLDWGCGHGRVIRHFAQRQVGQSWAVDIDPENVSWLGEHLPSVQASTVPLVPPTELPSDHFDLVYGISVMTHLTRGVQQLWLAELKRITKPGGLVVLTFAGSAAVAYASRFLDPHWLGNWRQTGFDDSFMSYDLVDKIPDPGYYRNTLQTEEWTRKLWGGHFAVLGVHPCVFTYQDVAILRA